MNALTQTKTLLLEGLLDPANHEIWVEFDARYRPVITGFSRRLGLPTADADDVAQETLTRFVRYYREGKYDRTRGRLSSWIMAIARHCAADLQQARMKRQEFRGESALVSLPDDDRLEILWDEESRRAIMDRAMSELCENSRVEGRTVRAFEMVAFEARAPADVAAELAMSVDSVYVAKNRCLTQLREIVARLNELYEVA